MCGIMETRLGRIFPVMFGKVRDFPCKMDRILERFRAVWSFHLNLMCRFNQGKTGLSSPCEIQRQGNLPPMAGIQVGSASAKVVMMQVALFVLFMIPILNPPIKHFRYPPE